MDQSINTSRHCNFIRRFCLTTLFVVLWSPKALSIDEYPVPPNLSANAQVLWKLLVSKKVHYTGLYQLPYIVNNLEEPEIKRLQQEFSSIPLVQYLMLEGQKNRKEITHRAIKEELNQPGMPDLLKRHSQTLQSFEYLLAHSQNQLDVAARSQAENHATFSMRYRYGNIFNLERGSIYVDEWNSLVWKFLENPPPTQQRHSISRATFESWKLNELRRLKEWLKMDVLKHLELLSKKPDGSWYTSIAIVDLQPGRVAFEQFNSKQYLRPHHLKWTLAHIPIEEQGALPTQKTGQSVPIAAEWFLLDQAGHYWALTQDSSIFVHNSLKYQIAFRPSFNSRYIREWFNELQSYEHLRQIAALLLNGFIMSSTQRMIDFLTQMPWQKEAFTMQQNLLQQVQALNSRMPTHHDFESALRMQMRSNDGDPELSEFRDMVDNLAWSQMKENVGYWHEREEKNKFLTRQYRFPDSVLAKQFTGGGFGDHEVPSLLSDYDMTNVSSGIRHGYFRLINSLFSRSPKFHYIISKYDLNEDRMEKISLDEKKRSQLSWKAIKPSRVFEGKWVSIPTADNAVLIDLSLRSVTGEPLKEDDFAIYKSNSSGSYVIKLLNTDLDLQHVYVDARFRLPKRKEEKLTVQLDQEILNPIILDLEAAGITTLSRGLKRALKSGPLSPHELASTVSNFSLYSYYPEKPQEEKEAPFSEFKKFLNPKGTLCFICNGSAGLLAEILNRALVGHPEYSVRVVRMLALEGNEIGLPGHAQVEILHHGKRVLLLDPTPQEKDPRQVKKESRAPDILLLEEEIIDEVAEIKHRLTNLREALLVNGEKLEPSSQLPAHTPFSSIYILSGEVLQFISTPVTGDLAAQVESFKKRIEENEKLLSPWVNPALLSSNLSTRDAELVYFHRALESDLSDTFRAMQSALYRFQTANSCENKLTSAQ